MERRKEAWGQAAAEAKGDLGDPLHARSGGLRDRALFDLAIDSKLRRCDLVKVRIGDLVSGGRVRNRAMVIQQKTKTPVQFELLEPARSSLLAWLKRRGGAVDNFGFPSRLIEWAT